VSASQPLKLQKCIKLRLMRICLPPLQWTNPTFRNTLLHLACSILCLKMFLKMMRHRQGRWRMNWIGILRTRRDPSAPLMHHFHGGRCVIILGFEIFAKFWFTLESWIRNIPRYCVHGPRLSCNSCYVHLRGATLLHLSSSMHWCPKLS